MIVADTSAVLAFLNQKDQHYKAVNQVFLNEPVIVVPVAVLGELAYMIESRLGQRPMANFLDDCQNGKFSLEWRESDLPRTQELMRQYANLPLGFADASVLALAEHVGRVATTDRRHFNIVKTKKRLELLP